MSLESKNYLIALRFHKDDLEQDIKKSADQSVDQSVDKSEQLTRSFERLVRSFAHVGRRYNHQTLTHFIKSLENYELAKYGELRDESKAARLALESFKEGSAMEKVLIETQFMLGVHPKQLLGSNPPKGFSPRDDRGFSDLSCERSRSIERCRPHQPMLKNSQVAKLMKHLSTAAEWDNKHTPSRVLQIALECGETDEVTLTAICYHLSILHARKATKDVESVAGWEVASVVAEYTGVPMMEEIKRLPYLSETAQLVTGYSTVNTLELLLINPPSGWNEVRLNRYVAWHYSKALIIKGLNHDLDRRFKNIARQLLGTLPSEAELAALAEDYCSRDR